MKLFDICAFEIAFSCIPDKDIRVFYMTDNSYLTHVISPGTE